ncbi:MAG TPA: 6-phosphogluconolactonase, partial [Rhabdochlamydiaceae bacterium]
MLEKRARLVIPGDTQTTLNYCVDHFLKTAREAIQSKGHFNVALSGGSTPKKI